MRREQPSRGSVRGMLKRFAKSLIPIVEAFAAEVVEVKTEALAFAEALRRYVGPGDPDPG